MPDRHVTRTGEDYAEAFQQLLPLGQAWPRQQDSVLMKVVRGLTEIWGYFEIRASKLLEWESDPRITIELLPDWERNYDLPDPCYQADQSVEARQKALVDRMTMEGGQSRQFFIDLAASIGVPISISEYRPFFVAMDCCGYDQVEGVGITSGNPMRNEWHQPIMDANGNAYVANGQLSGHPNYGLGPLANRYYWTVHVAAKNLTWFRCSSGICGQHPHLIIGIEYDVECLLQRWKPAHTRIVFDYSGLQDHGEMAGTP